MKDKKKGYIKSFQKWTRDLSTHNTDKNWNLRGCYQFSIFLFYILPRLDWSGHYDRASKCKWYRAWAAKTRSKSRSRQNSITLVFSPSFVTSYRIWNSYDSSEMLPWIRKLWSYFLYSYMITFFPTFFPSSISWKKSYKFSTDMSILIKIFLKYPTHKIWFTDLKNNLIIQV